MSSRILIIGLMLVSTHVARGQDERPVDASALLRAARDACRELGVVRYRARHESFGAFSGAGVIEGRVLLQRSGAPTPRFAVEGRNWSRDRAAPRVYRAAFDGAATRWQATSRRAVMEKRYAGLRKGLEPWKVAVGDLGRAGYSTIMMPFLAEEPLKDWLSAEKVEFEGRQSVRGVLCDVLWMRTKSGHDRRMFLGVDDHLPRRSEDLWVGRFDGKFSGQRLTVHDLRTGGDLAAGDFAVPVPDGWATRPWVEPRYEDALLPVGAVAPDFELATAAGGKWTLEAHAGRVRLIYFWATTCVPCLRRLPQLEKLRRDFAGRPVDFVSVSFEEPSNGDPAAMMKKVGAKLEVLVRGEKVAEAWGVRVYSTVYVVGPDGKVIHRAIGPDVEELTRAISGGLAATGR